MENKQNFEGFIGPSYTTRSERFDCQRTVNMYMEIDPLPTGGKGNQPAVLINTPGLKFLQTIGTGPIRGLYTQSNAEIAYVVSGNQVFQITGSVGVPVVIAGNLLTSVGAVQMTDNGTDLIIVDGQFGYGSVIGSLTLQQIVSPNFFPTQTISFQDTYFIGVEYGTQGMFVSNPNDITFPALNVAFKEGNPDILVAAVSLNRQLYMFGAKSTEVWWDAGQSSVTPFQRQDGRNSQVGCVAPYSVQVLGDTLFWLGTNAQGGGVVYTLANTVPTRVSTNAVEFAIQQLGDLTNATAYAYQQEGHYFYVLNIPNSNTTWVYDMTIQQWSERQSTINGITGRHLAENHCVLNGVHIMGDYRNGNIYAYDLNTYTDNGGPIYRIRQSPHYSKNLNRVFYKLMEMDFQFGVGLINGTSPRVSLQTSDDGGQTWSNPIYAALGFIGVYKARARWARLGSARDRVFRVICTDPVAVMMLSCYLDFETGNS